MYITTLARELPLTTHSSDFVNELKITCYIITGKHEVNITDLIQERLGNSIYTTVLAQYAGISERLLQWYINGKPVGSSNTVFNVKYDGLNSYLRSKMLIKHMEPLCSE